jgi:hypothetical protein
MLLKSFRPRPYYPRSTVKMNSFVIDCIIFGFGRRKMPVRRMQGLEPDRLFYFGCVIIIENEE